jgi:hypothetical protein
MAREVLVELAAFTSSLETWEMELSLDPDDAASVEAAISEMEEAVDSRAFHFLGNDPVMDLAEQMKEQFRQAIRAQRHEDAGDDIEGNETGAE